MKWITVLAAAAVLAAVIGTPPTSEAKMQSWIITGGALGEHAHQFYESWDEDQSATLPGDSTVVYDERLGIREIDPESVAAEEHYVLYSVWPFYVAEQLRTGERVMRYYPEHGLLSENGDVASEVRWYRLGEAEKRLLDDAIEEGLRLKEEKELPVGPLPAAVFTYEMEQGVYTFTPTGWGETLADSGRVFWIESPEAESFALEHLVETLERGPAGTSDERAGYSISIHVGRRNGGWGGHFGYYSPPADGEPGRFWSGSDLATVAESYYETTPGFDAAVQAAFERWAEETPTPSPTPRKSHGAEVEYNREVSHEAATATARAAGANKVVQASSGNVADDEASKRRWAALAGGAAGVLVVSLVGASLALRRR